MDPIDFFEDHLTSFNHCVPNWLLSRPYDLIFVLCTQLTPLKTIWPGFTIVYLNDCFQDHLTWFSSSCTLIYSFKHHLTWFLSLCTQLTPFKTIWSDFIIVCPLDSFSRPYDPDFCHCLSNWLLSRPFYLILSLCTQLTPFETLWPDFCTGYLIYSFQHQLT